MVMVVPTKEGWTMQKKYIVRLTDAERAVALEIVESVSHETVRRTLKKTG